MADDTSSRLGDLVSVVPLPLSQLLVRALNAKSAVERHNTAYFLAEATLKLSSALRIGLWLEHALEPGPVAAAFDSLVHPFLGHWVEMLRKTDAALGARVREGAELPMVDVLGTSRRGRDWPAVKRLTEAALDEDVIDEATAEDCARLGLEGFFGLVVEYRNNTIKIGQPKAELCDRMAPLWLDATAEVLAAKEPFGGARLTHRTTSGWQELTGLGPLPLDEPDDAAGTPFGGLAMVAGKRAVSIHPLVVFVDDDAQGVERVAFLNGAVRRRRKGAEGPVEVISRTSYLDYLTGSEPEGVEARAAMQAVLERVRGEAVSEDELADLTRQSIADASLLVPVEEVAEGSFLGDFHLHEELGRGSMGVVYRATQQSLQRVVAVKVLPPSMADDPVALERFRREVRSLERVDHANVVKVVWADLEAEPPRFAMELVDGIDLAEVRRRLEGYRADGERLTADHLARATTDSDDEEAPAGAGGGGATPAQSFYREVARLLAEAADGLHALHEQGVVHRDVKPSNLMLTAGGDRLVVMDLGIARLDDASKALTVEAASTLGTLRYIPPERLRGSEAKVDARTDVYGLGATAYEVVTGRRLFAGETEAQLTRQVLSGRKESPRKAAPETPKALSDILEVATASEPGERYESATKLADDLRQFATEGRSSARPPGMVGRVAAAARRRPALLALFLLVLIGGLIGGYLLWDWDRESQQRCANLAFRWGAPICVGELTDAEWRGRYYHYLVESRRGRVRRAERLNGQGLLAQPDTGHDRLAHSHNEIWPSRLLTVEYRDDGRVTRIVGFDRNNQAAVEDEIIWSDDGTAIVWYWGRGRSRRRMGDSSVVGARQVYDAQGFVTEARWVNAGLVPTRSSNGTFGSRLGRDATGMPSAETFLDPEGEPMARRGGEAARRYERDQRGDLLQQRYFDENGEPTLGPDWTHGRDYRRDRFGNVVEDRRIGLDGGLALDRHSLAAMTRTEWDEHGNDVRHQHFDEEEQPTTAAAGMGGLAFDHDGRGLRAAERFLDEAGEVVLRPHGNAEVRLEYDERGNATKQSYFDTLGNPTLCKHGHHGWVRQYDKAGNVLVHYSFGLKGEKVVTTKNGLSITKNEYDERGNQTAQRCYGPDEERVILADQWHSGYEARYDERGNLVSESYLGPDDEPILRDNGLARFDRRYDDQDRLIERIHLGLAGEPVPDKSGVARYVYAHDKRGNVVRREHHGTGQGSNLILNANGVAGWTAGFDARDNRVAIAFFDVAGEPTLSNEGIGELRYRFNGKNQETERSFHDSDGRPVLAAFGWSASRVELDARGRKIATTYLDTTGAKISIRAGYARVERDFDDRGNVLEQRFLDEQGRLTNHNDGYARRVRRYDERSYLAEESYFDPDGNPVATRSGCAKVSLEHDKRGHRTATECFDGKGKRVRHAEGYFRLEKDYDPLGRATEARYRDAEGKLMVAAPGFARATYRFDTRGNIVEKSYRDAADQPTLCKSGYFKATYAYDGRNKLLEERYFGTDGHPINRKGGYAKVEHGYDARGLERERAYRDATGQLVVGPDDYAKVLRRHNERGHVTQEDFFDAKLLPARHGRSYASIAYERDPAGRVTGETYLDAEGASVARSKGIAKLSYRYDARGREVERSYFDAEGRPAPCLEGFARRVRKVDPMGRVLEESYFDASGAPAVSDDGYARLVRSHDYLGHVTAEATFGADGEPVKNAEGFVRFERSYDRRGKQTLEIRFDGSGNELGRLEGEDGGH